MRATRLRDLAQALLLGFPKAIVRVGGRAVTFWIEIKGRCAKNTNRTQDASERGSPTRRWLTRKFTSFPAQHMGAAPPVHMQTEFRRATCEPDSFRAAPYSGRSRPGQNPPDSNRRRRGTTSLRTLVSPSAGSSVPGSQYALPRSPSPRACRMVEK